MPGYPGPVLLCEPVAYAAPRTMKIDSYLKTRTLIFMILLS